MKKRFVGFVLVALLVSTLAACGGGTAEGELAEELHIYNSVSYTHLTLPTKRIV